MTSMTQGSADQGTKTGEARAAAASWEIPPPACSWTALRRASRRSIRTPSRSKLSISRRLITRRRSSASVRRSCQVSVASRLGRRLSGASGHSDRESSSAETAPSGRSTIMKRAWTAWRVGKWRGWPSSSTLGVPKQRSSRRWPWGSSPCGSSTSCIARGLHAGHAQQLARTSKCCPILRREPLSGSDCRQRDRVGTRRAGSAGWQSPVDLRFVVIPLRPGPAHSDCRHLARPRHFGPSRTSEPVAGS